MKNASVEQVLQEIEENSEFYFMYNSKLIDVARKVNIKAKDKSIETILNEICKASNIEYSVNDKQIILRPKGMLGEANQQKTKTVKGIVNDPMGPVVGANVSVAGTTIGTITDMDGRFTLEVPENATLQISYIGYLTQNVKVDGKSDFTINLVEDSQNLDEVVVVGYGTVKKRDLTGSVASVSAEKITQVAVVNPALALQGRVPGVLVEQTSFAPGNSPKIRVRGNRSFNASNDPLYVVDGIPLTTGIEAINPSDIESIDVLKDASATAVYGARGANGVIIVTTKKGKAGKVQVDYNGYVGAQTVAKKYDLMNGVEWVEALREACRMAGSYKSPTPSLEEDATLPYFPTDPYAWESVQRAYDENGNYDPSKVRSFDWNDATLQTGLIHNHDLNVRGGSEKTQYSMSASYHYNDGVVKKRDYERYTVRLNLDQKIGNLLKVGLQTQYMHSLENKDVDAYAKSLQTYPVAIPYDDNGEFIMNPGGDPYNFNPLMNLENVIAQQKIDRYMGSYYLEANLWDGLKFRSNLGTDFHQKQDLDFRGSNTTANKGGLSTASNGGTKTYLFTLENMLTYGKQFKEHNLNVTLLQSIQRYTADTYSISVRDLPYEYQHFWNLGSAGTISGVSSNYQKWTLASFMGRVNYSFKDRYLLTVSARYDGSSRLAEGHKWVLFPSAALAWRIMDESFMQDIDVLSNLKLRVGWGRTGNSAVSPYQTMGGLSLKKYTFAGSNIIGFYPSTMPNHDLTWETTDQTNIGLDFGFFNNRLSGTVDLYLQKTHDLLMNRQLPIVSGYESVMANIGKTQNKGIEIALSSVNFESEKGFNWTTDLMLYANKEEIVELYNGKKDDIGNEWFIGQPIDVIYDYKAAGIWQDTPEDHAEMDKFNKNGANFTPGKVKVVDQNGDYKITAEDRVIIGNTRPKLVASLNNNFSYRGFDMSFLLNGEFGKKISYNAPLNLNGRENYVKVNYWTPTNPSNEYPRPETGKSPQYTDALRYYNGSYLRVENITLGYTLPSTLTKQAYIERLRLYATVQNPVVFTSFPGIDPEGARGSEYPSVRTFMFGVNVSF